VPERLDRVTVSTPNGDVVLSWEVRQALLELLSEAAPEVANRFKAVGATRPVELTDEQRRSLTYVLGEWLDDTPADMWKEVFELYEAVNRGEP
jgi:hypothetical protein